MSARTTAKPWRVNVAHRFTSEKAAYAKVHELLRSGVPQVHVYHWEDGSWRLYERVTPDR